MRSSAARSSAALLLAFTLFGAGAQYRLALPGYRYEFPRDHFDHPDFQTEWWYYTGNVRTAEGRRFGFELTFFRHGVNRDPQARGLWDVKDAWLAHLALSDIDGKQFFHAERLNRSGPGLAGADFPQRRVWNGNWNVQWSADFGEQQLQAVADRFTLDLALRSQKPPVIHGAQGVSQKAEGAGRASHYVSLTRLSTRGTFTIDGKPFTVEGLAWMDHEFFTHQLEASQSGWDWFSLQFQDNTELMLFRLRRKDGTADPYSAGTYVDAQGKAQPLRAGDFSLIPGKTWTSPATEAPYPLEWTIRVPKLALEASAKTRLPQQELTSKGGAVSAYWEGAIEIDGVKRGAPLRGTGYLEMTGYAGAVRMGE